MEVLSKDSKKINYEVFEYVLSNIHSDVLLNIKSQLTQETPLHLYNDNNQMLQIGAYQGS